MHVMARIALAFLPLLVGARLGLATCDPSIEPDRSDVANARTAVATVCDCEGAAAHRDYVRCAADQAAATLVNKGCTGVVKRCASKSTCGKPGYVACCRTRRSGQTSCALKRTAARCVAPNGGSACVGAVPSCCDACVAGGCSATTTTTSSTSTTSTLVPPPCGPQAGGTCGGTCTSLFDECVADPVTSACGCVLGPCRAIGGIGSCGGSCTDPRASCTLFPGPGGCACVIPCAGSGAPPCDPPCGPGQGCAFNPSTSACECVP